MIFRATGKPKSHALHRRERTGEQHRDNGGRNETESKELEKRALLRLGRLLA